MADSAGNALVINATKIIFMVKMMSGSVKIIQPNSIIALQCIRTQDHSNVCGMIMIELEVGE